MEGEIAGQQASDAEVVLQEFECDSGMMSMWQTHGYIYNDGVGQHQDGIVIGVGGRMTKSELVRMVVNAQKQNTTPQPTDTRSTTDRGFVASHSPMHAAYRVIIGSFRTCDARSVANLALERFLCSTIHISTTGRISVIHNRFLHCQNNFYASQYISLLQELFLYSPVHAELSALFCRKTRGRTDVRWGSCSRCHE